MQQWVSSLDAPWPLCLGGKLFEMHAVVEAPTASGLAHPSIDVTQKSSHSPRPLLLAVSWTGRWYSQRCKGEERLFS